MADGDPPDDEARVEVEGHRQVQLAALLTDQGLGGVSHPSRIRSVCPELPSRRLAATGWLWSVTVHAPLSVRDITSRPARANHRRGPRPSFTLDGTDVGDGW
jgi:hypothetical protein